MLLYCQSKPGLCQGCVVKGGVEMGNRGGICHFASFSRECVRKEVVGGVKVVLFSN